MPNPMVLGIGASVGGSVLQAGAARSAGRAQEAAANRQIDLQEQIYKETSANFAPYREGGRSAFDSLLMEMGLKDRPSGTTGFQASPGYQFALNQANDALQSSAAARGNLFSGATGEALQNNAIGMANQEYGNYYNRLAGLANMGQAAAGNQANAAANMGQNVGNALGAIGNAQAASAVGVGNAISGGINNAISTFGYMQQQPAAGQRQANAFSAPWGAKGFWGN